VALKRSLVERISPSRHPALEVLPESFRVNDPKIFHSDQLFTKSKSQVEKLFPGQSNPSGCAINWHYPNELEVTLSASGTKQGARKIDKDNPKLWPKICKKSFLNRYKELAQRFPLSGFVDASKLPEITYFEAKQAQTTYQKAKQLLHSSVFKNWIVNPSDLEAFV